MDMLYEGQDIGDSSREVSTNNNRNDTSELDIEDEISIPPSNIEALISDPCIRNFTRELEGDSFYHGSVANFQKVFYFNGGDSYAIPHNGTQVQPTSLNIARVVECWLKEKLFHRQQEFMPILEESPLVATQGIISKLKEEFRLLNGLSKVSINIRVGHIYLLHMIGDEIVMSRNYEALAQLFPLFVNVSIKVQPHSAFTRNHHNTCKVLVAVERMTMNGHGDILSPFGYNYQQLIDGTTARRVAFSADGQLCCILEEVEADKNNMNGTNYFFGGVPSVNMN
ncbi:10584_t:CDS:2 [Diversispora eburnea]|uniref:10584_t:CDS:1 n=1 Tax=Diversispora eburnea TaxID=1213867 RepID=A0A9N9G0Z0_9GLOM|nr:10584_t:CDS:2 [Diversispora eburnea]